MPFSSRWPRSFLPILALAGCASSGGTSPPPDQGMDVPSHAADTGAMPDAGVFVDPRDSQSYPTITAGDNTWLARNLNYTIAGSSFCYDDVAANCDADGRLYLWDVAPTACPPSSHLGSDDEWQALEAAMGMAPDQLDLEGYSTTRGTDEGTKLKAPEGFAARMAGFRTGATYDALGDRTYFWTSTMRGTEVWRRRIEAATPTVFRFTNPPATFAISIRCVLD